MASYKKATFGNLPFNHLSRIAWEEATRVINLIGPEAEPEIRRVAVVGRYPPRQTNEPEANEAAPDFVSLAATWNPVKPARQLAGGPVCLFAALLPMLGQSLVNWGELSNAAQSGTGPAGATSMPNSPAVAVVHTFGTPRPFHRVTSLQYDLEAAR